MHRGLLAATIAAALVVPVTTAEADVPVPAMTAPVTVVPSAGLPPEVSVDRSNANLAPDAMKIKRRGPV